MKFLTVQDVCKRFNISRNTLLRWRKDYNFPEIRIRGAKQDSIRFDEDQIDTWVERNQKRVEREYNKRN